MFDPITWLREHLKPRRRTISIGRFGPCKRSHVSAYGEFPYGSISMGLMEFPAGDAGDARAFLFARNLAQMFGAKLIDRRDPPMSPPMSRKGVRGWTR